MKVLITNWSLVRRAGTELYVHDLALGLLRRGHMPIIYSPDLGAVAKIIRKYTIPVVDDLAAVSTTPDVIHGHHYHETMTALMRFPSVPAIYVCHDWHTWWDKPPKSPRILRYAAVDQTCYDKLVYETAVPEERVRLMTNFVDLKRFKARASLPPRPKRVLILCNYTQEFPHLAAVREAFARAGLTVDVFGLGVGKPCERPEGILGEYDIVLAKGRAALEALATGAAVVLYSGWTTGSWAAGPMVNADELDRLLSLNLGIRAMTYMRDPQAFAQALVKEIARYDPQDAALVCERVRARCGRDRAADEFISLYEEVIAEYKARGVPDLNDEGLAASSYLRELLLSTKDEREILQSENKQLAAANGALRFQMEETDQARQVFAEHLSAQLSEKQAQLSVKEAELTITKNERDRLEDEGRQLRAALSAQEAQLSVKEAGLTSTKNERDTLEDERRQLRAALSAQEAHLKLITNSLAWRLLSRYGRIKYRYLLPVYRTLGLSRYITDGHSRFHQSGNEASGQP